MAWTVTQLVVDFNSDRATVALDSNSAPSTTVTLNFTVADNISSNLNRAAQKLDGATRKAVLAQAKQILGDAANAL